MQLAAEIIDVSALGSVIVASLVAGAGLTTAFSVVIVCATRAAEARRSGSVAVSVAFGLLAAIAVLACAALIVFGISVMVSK
jgi:hypothetical protein